MFADDPETVGAVVDAINSASLSSSMSAAFASSSSSSSSSSSAAVPRAAGITGTTTRSDREGAVRRLDDKALDALVLTLRAGAVGLNLTAANHVVFMAPCLDPSLRRQAIARCHRIGQLKKVYVTTLAVAGTLEDTALDLMDIELPPREVAGFGGGAQTNQVVLRTAALFERELLAGGGGGGGGGRGVVGI